MFSFILRILFLLHTSRSSSRYNPFLNHSNSNRINMNKCQKSEPKNTQKIHFHWSFLLQKRIDESRTIICGGKTTLPLQINNITAFIRSSIFWNYGTVRYHIVRSYYFVFMLPIRTYVLTRILLCGYWYHYFKRDLMIRTYGTETW